MAALQAQLIAQKNRSKEVPIHSGIGYAVGIKVAGGSAKLACEGKTVQKLKLLAEAFAKYPPFLAQSGRGGRLSVGAGKHGQ
jgi:hypothetical protein